MTTESTTQNKAGFIDFEPIFLEEQMYKIEAEYNTTWGVNRRIMMAMLSKSSKEIIGMVESMLKNDEKIETYFFMVEQLNEYEQHLKAGIGLVQAATSRLLMAGKYVAADTNKPLEQA